MGAGLVGLVCLNQLKSMDIIGSMVKIKKNKIKEGKE